MSLASVSIRRPVLAWMLTASIFLFGGLAFDRLGLSLLPDVDNPFVSVSVDYPGASPELVESDITEILEGALSAVEGVQSISSSSSYGSSRVSLEFNISKNINVALQEVQSAIQGVLRSLPRGVETPIVRKSNPEDQPILWVALSGPGETRELMTLARNRVRDRLSSVDGVSEVQLGGYIAPAIRIWVDPQALGRLELTHDDILNTLSSEHIELPAGRITRDKDEINLRFEGEVPSVSALREIRITRRSGQPLYKDIKLGEVARIEAGLEDIRNFARSDGQLAMGLGIKKQRGANSVRVADEVKALMKQIDLPEGYKLEVNFDSTQSIRSSIRELLFTLCLSVTLTAFVCWLFFGSLATTINIIIAIPTSLLGAFFVIHQMGYTLNNFTMLALILGVGIIVDDAIMVLENIFRWRKIERDTSLAALKGTEQVQFAAFATTLAIVAIFIPIVYVDGIIGAYLTQFAVTLAIAVSFSTFEALTFTPMRLASFRGDMRPKGIPKIFDDWVERTSQTYASLVARFQNHPWKLYLSVGLLFAVSLTLVPSIPKELTPDEDVGMLIARTELPLGTSLNETSRRLAEVEKILLGQEGVQRVYSIVGGFGGRNVNTSMIFITLSDRKSRGKSHIDIMNELREKFKKIENHTVRFQSLGGQSFGSRRGTPLKVDLKGSNWQELIETSKKLEAAMKADPMFLDVDSDYKDASPEFKIVPEREKAFARGVSLQAIASTLNFIFQGIKPVRFNDDGKRIDVIVQAEPSRSPSTPEEFRNLYVRNNRGQLVSMAELVTIREGSAPVSISRENRERNIELDANLAQGVSLDKALNRASELLDQVRTSDKVRIDRSQQAGSFGKSFRDLLLAIALGLIVAYMVLASQFNSYLDPMIILLAIPFSFSGAFVSLKLAGSSLNLFSMIGLLLLMGIVKKNSIMLVEFANQELEAQGGPKDAAAAMLEACRTRFRPILMTAFTTLAASIPPAFKIGIESSSSSSMATAIIGGLLLSTLLTFFVVPVAYIQIKSRLGKRHR